MNLLIRSLRFYVACGSLLIMLYVGFVLNTITTLTTQEHPAVSANNLQDDYIAYWSSNDSRLIDHIRKYYLYSPSTLDYNLVEPDKKDWSQHGVAKHAAKFLENKKNGFFVEVGGYDGETGSNTLMFEMFHNYSGLIIEPDDYNFEKLVNKNRKCWLVKACLSGGHFPEKMNFVSGKEIGSLAQSIPWPRKLFMQFLFPTSEIQIWCFPIGALLRAVKATAVNYFSLDVEGAELNVLTSLAYEKDIRIQLLQVEYMVWAGVFWNQYKSEKRRNLIDSYIKINFPGMSEKERKFMDSFYVNETFQ